MAKIIESEIQFAFLFFHKFLEMLQRVNPQIVVPSTYREGRLEYDYNGTDLVIDEFFIQFKTSFRFDNNKGRFGSEHDGTYFYYETHNSRRTAEGQFNFLKTHAADRNKNVWYVAPSFDNDISIDNWFQDFAGSNPQNLNDFSCIVDIGNINWQWPSITTKHYVSYRHSDDYVYCHSEPQLIKKKEFQSIKEISIEDLESKQTIRDKIIEYNSLFNQEYVGLLAGSKQKKANIKKQLLDLQQLILIKYDVLWTPVVLRKNEQRDLIINTLI